MTTVMCRRSVLRLLALGCIALGPGCLRDNPQYVGLDVASTSGDGGNMGDTTSSAGTEDGSSAATVATPMDDLGSGGWMCGASHCERSICSLGICTADPRLNYGRTWAHFVEGVAIPELVPELTAASATFSVEPALPDGLMFDSGTGVISGTPNQPAPAQPYTITVEVAGAGQSSWGLTIAVVHGFGVTTHSDGNDQNPGDGICQAANGLCTLRAAIDEANSSSGEQGIYLPQGQYVLIGDELWVTDDVVVYGDGPAQTTVIAAAGSRVMAIDSVGDARLWNLSLRGGTPNGGIEYLDHGGSLRIDGTTAYLSNVVLRDGTAQGRGGGLYGDGSEIDLEHCEFRRNHAVAGGGAAFVLDGTISVRDTVFVDNESATNGGAIAIEGDTATWRAQRCLLADNRAVAGEGGAAMVHSGYGSVENCFITGNIGNVGAAVAAGANGVVSLTSVTLADNAAGDPLGGALTGAVGSTFVVQNSLIQSNTSAGSPDACGVSGTMMVSNGDNLVDGTDQDCSFDQVGDEVIENPPALGILGAHGGLIPSLGLPDGHPAIDRGATSCPDDDGRSLSRPEAQLCDIGALEVQ